jgi:hypothetical protein
MTAFNILALFRVPDQSNQFVSYALCRLLRDGSFIAQEGFGVLRRLLSERKP